MKTTSVPRFTERDISYTNREKDGTLWGRRKLTRSGRLRFDHRWWAPNDGECGEANQWVTVVRYPPDSVNANHVVTVNPWHRRDGVFHWVVAGIWVPVRQGVLV